MEDAVSAALPGSLTSECRSSRHIGRALHNKPLSGASYCAAEGVLVQEPKPLSIQEKTILHRSKNTLGSLWRCIRAFPLGVSEGVALRLLVVGCWPTSGIGNRLFRWPVGGLLASARSGNWNPRL